MQSQLLQHARHFCLFLCPRVCSNSFPFSPWCRLTISSSVTPFSCCLYSFPTSGSFPVSQLFTSGGQRVGASASASVFLMNIQGWSPKRGQLGKDRFRRIPKSKIMVNSEVKESPVFLRVSSEYIYVPICSLSRLAEKFYSLLPWNSWVTVLTSLKIRGIIIKHGKIHASVFIFGLFYYMKSVDALA